MFRFPILTKEAKKQAIGFRVGQTKAKANAKVVGEMLEKKLGG